MGHTSAKDYEDEIQRLENYTEFLTDNYITASGKLNELISYIESDEYGNLISKDVIVRALKKLSEEM